MSANWPFARRPVIIFLEKIRHSTVKNDYLPGDDDTTALYLYLFIVRREKLLAFFNVKRLTAVVGIYSPWPICEIILTWRCDKGAESRIGRNRFNMVTGPRVLARANSSIKTCRYYGGEVSSSFRGTYRCTHII